MKHGIVIASVLALAAIGVHEARAGAKYNFSVVSVNHTSQFASGSLGTARGTSDTVQHIGCSAWYWPGVAPSLTCIAQPATGSGAACSTSDPSMLAMFEAMPNDAFLRFEWEGGACTSFLMHKRSQNQPIVP